MAAQSPKEFNGWEFLKWDLSQESAKKILDGKKDSLGRPNATDANFKYREMNIWLDYGKENKLNKVKQRLTFAVFQSEEAGKFFEKTKARMIKMYGKPDKEEINKKDSVINMDWKLKYTGIHLNYDHKYKIIDEFGGGSYWVEINFEPVKK